MQRIRDVKLENNPLICDRCHMGSLIDIARSVSWSQISILFMCRIRKTLFYYCFSFGWFVCMLCACVLGVTRHEMNDVCRCVHAVRDYCSGIRESRWILVVRRNTHTHTIHVKGKGCWRAHLYAAACLFCDFFLFLFLLIFWDSCDSRTFLCCHIIQQDNNNHIYLNVWSCNKNTMLWMKYDIKRIRM